MTTAVITIDGVLRKTMGGTIIEEGRRLYLGFVQTGGIVLLTHDDTPHTGEWLELNGFVRHDLLYSIPPHQRWYEAANDLRRQGYHLDLAVVADPDEARALINSGFNTLLFTHSQYAMPEWRPDAPKGVTPWDDITKQVADLARMKAADVRLKDDD